MIDSLFDRFVFCVICDLVYVIVASAVAAQFDMGQIHSFFIRTSKFLLRLGCSYFLGKFGLFLVLYPIFTNLTLNLLKTQPLQPKGCS